MMKKKAHKKTLHRTKDVQRTATTAAAPEWINRMHEYFTQAGTYRTDDVQRVLGDPGAKFQVKAAEELSPVCKVADD